MEFKWLLLLTALIVFIGTASAANPTITMLNNDGNYFYPAGGTGSITFMMSDADDPPDMNIHAFYMFDGNMVKVAINPVDRNSITYCTTPGVDVNRLCTITWSIPSFVDDNVYVDVNVVDVTTSDDINGLSGSIQIDTNACDTNYTESGGVVTLETLCTGYGSTATIYYNKSRTVSCGENYKAYSLPVSSTFGEFTLCYYSVDSLGNRELTQSATFTADSDAYEIALLTELALAGLLLFAILGAVVLWKQQLSGGMVIALVISAVIVAISIYIFAVVL